MRASVGREPILDRNRSDPEEWMRGQQYGLSAEPQADSSGRHAIESHHLDPASRVLTSRAEGGRISGNMGISASWLHWLTTPGRWDWRLRASSSLLVRDSATWPGRGRASQIGTDDLMSLTDRERTRRHDRTVQGPRVRDIAIDAQHSTESAPGGVIRVVKARASWDPATGPPPAHPRGRPETPQPPPHGRPGSAPGPPSGEWWSERGRPCTPGPVPRQRGRGRPAAGLAESSRHAPASTGSCCCPTSPRQPSRAEDGGDRSPQLWSRANANPVR